MVMELYKTIKDWGVNTKNSVFIYFIELLNETRNFSNLSRKSDFPEMHQNYKV